MKYHCFFEQSGTFKNEFKKLGYDAEDYDILNQFNETDHVVDLFAQIDSAYAGGASIFDKMEKDKDFIIAFFPCVRFEDQIILHFKGKAYGVDKWSIDKKLRHDLKLHRELHELYTMITKLALICLDKKLSCIIENPYSTQHYLYRYWALEPAFIDYDRREMGDYYEKPTQYFFINCDPKFNFIFEGVNRKETKKILKANQVERSMISKDYANRFIREFILDESEWKDYD